MTAVLPVPAGLAFDAWPVSEKDASSIVFAVLSGARRLTRDGREESSRGMRMGVNMDAVTASARDNSGAELRRGTGLRDRENGGGADVPRITLRRRKGEAQGSLC